MTACLESSIQEGTTLMALVNTLTSKLDKLEIWTGGDEERELSVQRMEFMLEDSGKKATSKELLTEE